MEITHNSIFNFTIKVGVNSYAFSMAAGTVDEARALLTVDLTECIKQIAP